MNNTLKSMLIAASALTAVSSFAQDKSTLDLLVKKGVITAEERAAAMEDSSNARAASGINRVFPKEDATKRLTISGYFQSQYESFASSSKATSSSSSVDSPSSSGFIMRRLYLEILADIGEGLSGNVVMDMSGNTNSRTSSGKDSYLDRAMLSLAGSYGTVDLGYRKVAWGYEESTLSSLFKASSSKLLTVERGITNRYWNEAENGSADSISSDGRRLGFGAHHVGVFYSSVPNPQGLEYGLSVTNANRDFSTAGAGQNDLGLYANLAYNNKVSDNEKYAVGVNYGSVKYFNAKKGVNALAEMEGFNPFVQAQYFNWTVMAEYFNTKITSSKDAATNVTNDADATPTGYNVTVAYKLNDNWEAVARYSQLDTDNRGIAIGDGVRDYSGISSNYNKVDSYYLGLNYFFTLNALGSAVYGPNAKIQFGYELSKFDGKQGTTTGSGSNHVAVFGTGSADVNSIRLQAQVAF